METITKTKLSSHPMEDVLDIEPCTTMTEYTEITPVPTVESPIYDDKDNEIDDKLETIYTTAMTSAEITSEEIEKVEGKYKARLGDVTAAMLNVALSAVREKRELKQHKDKLTPGGGTTTTNNNLIVADRNEIIRMIRMKNES